MALRRMALPIALALFFAACAWDLAGPPPWWDEGWTLSVARNIVERGIYARLLDGQTAPHGLEAAVPVTELVAASFRLFGIGLWQGRLPIVLSGTLAVGLLWALAARAYGARVAWGALAALLLLPMHPQIHPFIMTRQVLAEMPMLALLLGGMLCADAAGRGRLALAVPATLLWLLAIIAKAQVLPFWACAIAAGVAAALALRRWRYALTLTAMAIIAVLAYQPTGALLSRLANQPLAAQPVSGLFEVIVVVAAPAARMFALQVWLLSCLLPTAGMIYAAWRGLRSARSDAADTTALRASLLGLAGSWMGWYVLLSVGSPRYLFPATFVAAIFTALLLHDLTGGFSLAATMQTLTAPLRDRRLSGRSLGVWLAAPLVLIALLVTLQGLGRFYLNYHDDSAAQVAAFFNSETPPGTRVETYESELHFLLDRPYHYPPDQAHVELNRRSLLGQADTPVNYDPLAADPDYLVVGRFARENGLYEPAIRSGAFRLAQTVGGYAIYERVR